VTDPPRPGLTAILLTVAAKFGYRVTTRDTTSELGCFLNGTEPCALVMVGSPVTWALVDTPPRDCPPYLVSRSTYEILHEGTLNPDGSIAYRGQSYCVHALVQAVGSSFRFVAEAIAV
jgi:hypothetical protein